MYTIHCTYVGMCVGVMTNAQHPHLYSYRCVRRIPYLDTVCPGKVYLTIEGFSVRSILTTLSEMADVINHCTSCITIHPGILQRSVRICRLFPIQIYQIYLLKISPVVFTNYIYVYVIISTYI